MIIGIIADFGATLITRLLGEPLIIALGVGALTSLVSAIKASLDLKKDARSIVTIKDATGKVVTIKAPIQANAEELAKQLAEILAKEEKPPKHYGKDPANAGWQRDLSVSHGRTPASRNQVFISYSHEDKRWRDDLHTHLTAHLRGGSIVSWSDDQQIAPGSDLRQEIESALTHSKVAVLLVSPEFLASDFIREHELPLLFKEAEQGGIRVLWVPVRASAFKETALKDYQAVLDVGQPLANMTDAERDQAWVRIGEEIEKAIGAETGTNRGQTGD